MADTQKHLAQPWCNHCRETGHTDATCYQLNDLDECNSQEHKGCGRHGRRTAAQAEDEESNSNAPAETTPPFSDSTPVVLDAPGAASNQVFLDKQIQGGTMSTDDTPIVGSSGISGSYQTTPRIGGMSIALYRLLERQLEQHIRLLERLRRKNPQNLAALEALAMRTTGSKRYQEAHDGEGDNAVEDED